MCRLASSAVCRSVLASSDAPGVSRRCFALLTHSSKLPNSAALRASCRRLDQISSGWLGSIEEDSGYAQGRRQMADKFQHVRTIQRNFAAGIGPAQSNLAQDYKGPNFRLVDNPPSGLTKDCERY